MNGEWIFVIGAIVGFFISLATSYVGHLFKLREQSVSREFEMRKEGKDFYLTLYGRVAGLDDLAMSYQRSVNKGKGQVLVKDGFLYMTPDEIIKHYGEAYKEFAKFMADSRDKGYELFLPRSLATSIKEMWGFADFLAEESQWEISSTRRFGKLTFSVLDNIEKILGLKPTSVTPKWLKPSYWLYRIDKLLGYSGWQ